MGTRFFTTSDPVMPSPHRAALLVVLLLLGSSTALAQATMPYAEAGWSTEEAAHHLLQRFAYGPRPGDVDQVVAQGLEAWFDQQLQQANPDGALAWRLEPLDALAMTPEALVLTFPNFGVVRARALRDSILTQDEQETLPRRVVQQRLRAYMETQGWRPQRDLFRQLVAHKILRARYSENQLAEVLTDFWFNHFNVSMTDGAVRPHLFGYERDAIRPYVLTDFRSMLGATARHPAMLFYLDNAQSNASDSAATRMDYALAGGTDRRLDRVRQRRQARQRSAMDANAPRGNRRSGINENYARELLELHTLGVDGGYTQADVVDVARAFTGWTVLPPGPRGDAARQRLREGERLGFAHDGMFLFRANMHDASAKTILGHHLPAGGGLDEGERVLDLLATHPATARHLAHKLAVRFVSDTPPQALVDALATVYLDTDGDLAAVIRALAYSPHFWAPEARQAKVKAPFELAMSMLRTLDADVEQAQPLYNWLETMGQPLYQYQAPTGFPDEAAAWINSGTLVSRMNFAMNMAIGRVRGVSFDLAALNGHREPASLEAALHTYAAYLLPSMPPDEVTAQLLPLVQDPAWADKLTAADEAPNTLASTLAHDDALARVVGVLLGAPAFQRR